jgi:hypothetical protein
MKNTFATILTASALITSTNLHAAQTAAIGDVVQIGCTIPSATGALVYSIDNYKYGTGGIASALTLPDGVTLDVSCTAAINAMLQDANNTCPGGSWHSGDLQKIPTPTNYIVSGSGYSLQNFMFKCLPD